MKRYIPIVIALLFVAKANAQNDFQRTPKGAQYKIFTTNPGEKIKQDDIVTFDFVQKNEKDSVLISSAQIGHPVQVQIHPSQNVADLMEVFPLLTVKDSAIVKVPSDSIFVGHEDQRPPFIPKGTNLVFILKIDRVQSLSDAIAERNAGLEKVKAQESIDAANYIASHKLNLHTTPSGLKYVITQPSVKTKVQKGDTVLVNYAGRSLNDKVFDSSIESIAKQAGLDQPGRTYEPIEVVVGNARVIPGWDEGLQLLNEGSKATFVIPSNLAYGEQGQGDIKPYSTLVFDIEIVKVKPTKHVPAPVKAPAKKPLYRKKATQKKS